LADFKTPWLITVHAIEGEARCGGGQLAGGDKPVRIETSQGDVAETGSFSGSIVRA
jgi:hypothetical protein